MAEQAAADSVSYEFLLSAFIAVITALLVIFAARQAKAAAAAVKESGEQTVLSSKSLRAQTMIQLHQLWLSGILLEARNEIIMLEGLVNHEMKSRTISTRQEKDEQMKELYKTKLEALKDDDYKKYRAITNMCHFWEVVGYMVKADLLPLADVVETYGHVLLGHHDVFERWVTKFTADDPYALEHMGWLINQTYQYAKEEKGVDLRSDQQVWPKSG